MSQKQIERVLTALNTVEAAKEIGRSQAAVYMLVARGEIPHRKVGSRRLVFFREELQQWMQGGEGVRLEDLRQGN